MSRVLLLVGIVALTLVSAGWAGDERSKAMDRKRAALEDELRVLLSLLSDRGPMHPSVVALKERIAQLNAEAAQLKAEAAQGEPVSANGLLVVISKQNVAATLKDARIRSIGGRSFVVGIEVKGPNITKGQFAGMVVWIPLNDVIQMVEMEGPEQKKEQPRKD